jgi:broad specificity phosphatase PhoE/predicted nucleotidyltransferase
LIKKITKIDRNLIARKLFKTLAPTNGIESISLVGSICDKDDVSVISDIDTIVICSELDEVFFNSCIDALNSLSGADLGFPDREIIINSTFGPLKFDAPEIIVIHLMIYDLRGHKQHVLKSPFTCLDWERSNYFYGKSLKEIYPVHRLQPNHFVKSRRGLRNYLDDIRKGVISYRRYTFLDGKPKECSDNYKLDCKHQGEYAFHIVKYLISNYLKLVTGKNIQFSDDELFLLWKKYLPECSYFIPFFKELRELKTKRSEKYPQNTIQMVEDLLISFENSFHQKWNSSLKLIFVRHGRTAFNDGSFLGQGRDPEIIESLEPLGHQFQAVYTSPFKRSIMTAKELSPKNKANLDSRLSEINYGKAEGIFLEDLKKKFPYLYKSWSKGKDARFPDGENHRDVMNRLKLFLNCLQSHSGSVLVVTHNVVIRCLVGMLWKVPMSSWYKIVVPHAREVELLCLEKRYYLNMDPITKEIMTDSLI